MKIIFFGSSHFAISSLKALLAAKYLIPCVVTQPDKKKGRGLSLTGTEIKRLSEGYHIKIYQPQSINAPESISFLKSLSADLFVVIAYGQILNQKVLDMPKLMPLNVHASMLPLYRGAAPINWAIINGEKSSGISVIKMVREMDAGPIILQEKIDISDDDTTLTLEDKLSVSAAGLLMAAVKSIENNSYKLILQDETKVSFAPKLTKISGKIDWDSPAGKIHNIVRGCLGWPGSFTYHNARLLKICKVKAAALPIEGKRVHPGEVVDICKEGIVVATVKGNLIIEELQPEGKRVMKAAEFISGRQIRIGDTLGIPTPRKP